MPIFEYLCDDCGTKFEKLVRRAGGVTEQIECPSCGRGDHLSEQYSTFAAHANGASKADAGMPSCPSGMCQTPGMCGRNFN
jgi:putative FmdB family regulatory protein